MSLAVRTVKNVIWRTSSGTLHFLLAFAATPFIVSRLGDTDYGLLIVLASLIIGYFAALDLDLTTATNKFVA